MTPADNSVYKTLSLLVMLSRSRKQATPNLPEEEKAILTVSKQVLSDSNLILPEFTNALHALSQKGYVWHMVLFDDNLRSQINEFINSPQYKESLDKLAVLDTKEFSEKLKASASQDLKRMLPAGIEIDQEQVDSDELTFTEAFREGIQMYQRLGPDGIALVILMPFRDINKIYSRMGNGEKFSDIRDDGFWYDQVNYNFYIEGESISTAYHNEPTLAHYVIKEFFNNPSLTKVDYEDIAEFDVSRGETAYSDALRKFVKKHPKLKDLFTVRKYTVEFHPEKY